MIDASSLYPSMAQPAAAAEAPPPQAAAAPAHYMQEIAAPEPAKLEASTPEEKAETLYAKPEAVELQIPDNIAELRKGDDLRGMYPPEKQFVDVINDRMFEGETEPVAPAVQAALVKEVANIAADLGMTAADVRSMRTVGQVCNTTPPNDETRMQWREQAVQRLNETYGKDATQAYRDAITFAQRDPRVMQVLNEGGRGDHPDTVLLFAKLARQARTAGKLK